MRFRPEADEAIVHSGVEVEIWSVSFEAGTVGLVICLRTEWFPDWVD